ncbi:MAG: efflux transporter periplasmic adaptor subunit, partial [Sphingomonas sp.]
MLAGCGNSNTKKGRGPSGPPQVGYVILQATSVPITTELAGRTTAYESSEVRPQVS